MADRPDWGEARTEYRPASARPRSASTGRLRQLSATYGGQPLRPTTANDWGNREASAAPPQRRVFSAISQRPAGAPPIAAWTSPSDVLPEPSRRVHVQALVRNKRPELLAEDLMATKEQLTRAREESMMAMVEKRRLEAEVIKLRSSLLKSEELLNNKERMMSPTLGISQLYRSPDTTHLVANLKEQNRELRVARDSLADELMALNRSTRATRMAEIQSELFAAHQELERMREMNKALDDRLIEAEEVANAAVDEAQSARRTLDEYIAIGAPVDPSSLKVPANSSISGGGVRKTLQALHQAHKMLMNQAALIRAVFPTGLSMKQFQDKARQKVNTAGAPDILNFIRNHISKLQMELAGQPGDPAAALAAAPSTGGGASPSASPAKVATREAVGGAQDRITNQAQLLEAVSGLLRKLRGMEEERFHANPEFESSSEQLADMMQLYVDEVRRLQGKGPSPTPPPVPPPTQPAPARTISRQSSVKAPSVEAAAPAPADPEPPKPAPVVSKPPSVAASTPATQPVDPVPYTVYVTTSDVSGGAFDGSVFIVLQGDKGTSTEVQLPSDRYSFDTGETNEFEMPMEDVGKVQSVFLRMEVEGEETSGDDTWHLASVRVQSARANAGEGVDATFVYEEWVKPSVKVQLFPEANSRDAAEYEVQVFTADIRGAGTDGKVSIRLVGDKGASRWVDLDKPVEAADGNAAALFSRGAIDTFAVTAADVGDLSHVVVRLGSVQHSDWNLTKIEALHQGTGWKSVFQCCDWITRKENVVVLLEGDTWLAKTRYTLGVRTSDLKGADFDGRAFITLSGYWGTTKEIRLARPGKPTHGFPRGGEETFEVMADEVGPITNITVRVEAEAADLTDAWGLAEVNVTCGDSAWAGGQFVFGGWLSGSVPSTTIWKYREPAEYKVTVFTSAEAGADFDGDVYLTLTGAYGSTDELLLVNDSSVEGPPGVPKTLYTGSSYQEFTVKATNVGNLTTAKVRIAATGTTSSWLLDRIEVQPPPEQTSDDSAPAPTKPCTFNHKAWVYPESAASINKLLEAVEYEVKVTTSENSDAFDGDVYLTFTGLDGSSEEQRLVNGKSGNFDASAVAEFVVKAGDVGQLNTLNVRIDPTGTVNWWSLTKVEVKHKTSGAVTYFRYNGWLNAYWNSSTQLSSQSLFEYRVDLYVADGDAGNFDGDVFVMLHGNYATDYIRLSPAEGALCFSSKAPASATLKLSDLGTPYRADVKAVPKPGGRAKSFKLDRIELTNNTAGSDPFRFPYTSKGSVGDDDIAYVQQVAMLNHTLYLYTAADGGDFSGPAFVTLECENGETEEVALLDSEGNKPTFTVGCTYLSIRTYDLGKVTGVKVRAAGGRWALERMEMYSHTGNWTTFTWYCGKTLNNSSASLQRLDNTSFVVTVASDDVRGNGTDGNLLLTLVGEFGSTSECRLYPDSEGEKAYERGTTTKATLDTIDVGRLSAVRVKLEPQGWWAPLHSGLKLGEVTVLHPTNGTLFKFPCGSWLDEAEKVSELKLGEELQVFQQYRVSVVGSYSTLSEYSYDARIKLKGESGESRIIKLAAAEAETDAETLTTIYTVGTLDVGALTSIEFAVGDDSTSSYLHISRVEVLNTETRAQGVFPINQYIYSWNGLSSFDKAPRDTSYTVEVTTASLTGAKGFDGGAYLVVHGDKASSEEMKLENWWSSGFQPGSRQTFYCTSVNVGVISAVTVRTEDPSPGAKWGLATLEVTNSANNSRAVCEWKKGYIQAGTTVKIPKSQEQLDYELTLTTGDVRGAGTDADVEVQIGGASGSSPWVKLGEELRIGDTSGTMLARASTNRFALRGLPDIGDDRWVAVRLVGDDVHSSWYLASAELLNTNSGLKSTFNANTWVNLYSEPRLQEASAVQTMVPYTILVKTSNIRGSDFEGEAFIKLNGYDGCSDWLRLVKQGYSKSSFLRDETASFTLNACETGYLYSVEVKIVPNDNDPNWNLEEVRVQKKDGEECVFHCGKWLDIDNPSASLSRWQDSVKYRLIAYTSASDAPTPTPTDPAAAAADATASAPAAFAPFDGKAYVTLNGSWGSSSEIELVNDATSWAPGEAQAFDIDASNVGSLLSVSLRTVAGPSGQPAKWVLECVEVSKVEGSDPATVFKKTETAADGSSALVPVAVSTGAEAVTLSKDRAIKEYKVVVVTADAADSAFDGDVYLTLSGNDGSGEETKLTNTSSAVVNFGVSASAEFTLKLPDFNGVRSVCLRADFTGAATNWNLARVEVANVEEGSKTPFTYNSYLNKDCTTAWIYPQSSYTCKVAVRTADAPGAAFDGRVFLQLSSYWDKTVELPLVSEEGFKAGTTHEFTVKSCIGYCNDVTLRIEPVDGGATKWQPEYVILNFEESCCQQYARNSGGTMLTKDSPAATFTTVWMSNYSLELETSDSSDPFDGSLYLTLVNTDPADPQESNEVKVDLGEEPLRAGSKTSVTLSLASITYNAMRLRTQPRDGSTSSAGAWTPGRVQLSGSLFVFDTAIRVPGSATGAMLASRDYEFKVHTADVRGNGTDGELSAVLVGNSISTPEARLGMYNSDALEPGKASSATASLPDVGPFKELQLKLVENGGPVHSALYVEKVEVTQTSTGMMTTFPINAWISKSGDITTATAAGPAEDVYVDYTFDVYSSAGSTSFDGEVQFKLEGPEGRGDTGSLTLGTGGGDGNGGLFQAGSKETVRIRGRDVGAPTKLYGNVNFRGSCNAWALGRVEVTNTKSGEKKVFKLGGSLYTWNWWYEVPELPTAQYQVLATTANTGERGFDGEVYLVLQGEDGSTDEVQLAPSDGCFQPSGSDSFLVTVADVGRLNEATVRVAKGPSGRPCKWALACLNVSNLSSGMQAVFEYDGAIAAGSSTTIAKTVVRVQYQVTVRTSDVRGADTDGQVYLTLSGDQGVTDEQLLSSDPESFRRGAVFETTFNAVEVGGARQATVRLAPPASGGELHSGWHLGSVEVLNMGTGIKGTFNHNAWLPLAGGSATLEEANAVPALHEYTVSLNTTDQKDADFDGKAWITILSWSDQTAEMPLVLPGRTSASFKAGETSTFVLKGVDVGYVRAVRVRMEPSASDPEWCLATIAVVSGDSTYEFTYGNRLNAERPSAEISSSRPPAEFLVTVYTSDMADAGYEGELSVQVEGLYDSYNWDEPRALIPADDDTAGLSFAPGSARQFRVPATDIGVLTKLFLIPAARPEGSPPLRWHLDKVTVRNAESEDSTEYTFLHRDWVSLGEDGQLKLARDMPSVDWKVVVVTGDGADAALPDGGEVSLWLQGSDGKTDTIKLTPDMLTTTSAAAPAAAAAGAAAAAAPAAAAGGSAAPYRPFGRGAADAFVFPAANVGQVSYAVLRWDPSPAAAASGTAPASTSWFVNKLDVVNSATGATSILSYKSALSAGCEGYLWPQSSYNFKAVVVTSDVRGTAAFDGDVYITASNDWSSPSEEVKLTNSASTNFERGSRSEFTFTLQDLSFITKLDVRIDPTGSVKALPLDRVELYLEGGWGANSSFSCKDVLQAPDKLTVSLTAVQLHDYEAYITSSAESEPFNGKVFLTLLGDQSKTEEATDKVELDVQPDPDAPAGAAGKFMPGSRVVCKFKVPQLSFNITAATIDVEFPAGEGGKGWQVERMELRNVTWGSAPTAFFVDSKFNTQKTGITIAALEDCEYEVTVRTSDLPAAGTDGSAFLTVYGSSGDSGEQALSNDSAAMFDRASSDVFTFNCKDLGDIKKLVLRLADSSGGGVHSQWHVASVDVLHKRSGWCTPFTFDEWLQVDSSATRDKPQAARNVYQPHTITVTTADTEDASFSGDVSLVLRGTSGATTFGIPLSSAGRDGKSPFAAGSKAEFRVRAADVWPLESATVSMVTGPNSGSSWRPLKLEVRNDESGATATFGNDSTLLFYWDGAQELKLLPGDGNVSSGADEDEKRREEERREEEERKARELEEEERRKREQEEELKKQQEQEEEERKRKEEEEEERKRKEEEEKQKAAGNGGDPTPPTTTPTPPGVRTNDNFTDTETDMGDSATDMFDSVSIRSGSMLRG